MIDRSKFKASSLSKQKEIDQQSSRLLGKSDSSTRGDMLEIEEGINRFRIYPAHPDGGGEVYAEPVAKVFLPALVPEKDRDGKEITDSKGRVQMKESMKPIFNSKLHGGTPKDLVEEYIGLAKKFAEDLGSEKQLFLDKIYGKYSPNAAQRLPGCNYQQTWVMYADKLGAGDEVEKFGRLEVKKSIKDKMNKKAAIESANDPLGVDPFSDAETGLPVIITYNKPQPGVRNNPNDVYDVEIDKTIDRRTKMLIEYPLSDEQLESFLSFTPLHKIFRNSFKRKDFEFQVEGLRMFDEKYTIGIFDTPEFQEVLEEIEQHFPVGDDVDEVEEPGEDLTEEENEEEAAEADMFELMNRVEMQAFIRSEKLGIVIKPSMSDDKIREQIRLKVAAGTIPYIPLPGEDGYVEPKSDSAPKSSAMDRLNKLRKSK